MKAIPCVLATLALVGACTGTPGSTATLGTFPVVTPVASPTVAATTSSTTTPTFPSTTTTPAPVPSATPTQPGASPTTGGFGADTFLFSDDFSDTSGGWALPSYNQGTNVTYDPGETLRLDLQGSSAAYSASGAIDDEAWDVLRVQGTFRPEAGDNQGYFGLMCGAATDDLVAAVISTDGRYVFLREQGLSTDVLDIVLAAIPAVPPGSSVLMGLECAGTATGSLRMQLSVDSTVVATYQGADGPAQFVHVGVFAEAISEMFLVHLDDVFAFGGVAADLPPAASLPPPATPASEPVSWYSDASDHRGQNGDHFVYSCPPGGSPGSVYGTDRYTDDSSVCTAAVHAGLITFAAGGSVTIEIQPDAVTYTASERNGVSSGSWSTWYGSFVFVTP